MSGVDSGIKVDTATCGDITALEKRDRAFIIMQIGKPEGGKTDKVLTKFQLTSAEVADVVAKGSVNVNGTEVALPKRDEKAGETDAWLVFRAAIPTFPIAVGSCFVEFKTKDGRDTDKLIYVTWNPDSASVKDKMKYSSTKIHNKFTSSPTKHQAGDLDDITFAEVAGILRK